ncbi:fumarylacetoacetate hydrolase family protein [Caulobacter sp. NIBR2454]|uniref:fumarylacetoacetate hydrolase family protein n=1 Tax=Caulobacter sp. NIBR2454 TaxID=3015996 RepID=UPI0022B6783B|nr:fumarylacetoacetate hydrolase family protein [Caulobacter sp. NIBR2454]
MIQYAVAPQVAPTVPVLDSEAVFPVRRILCVGRNYDAHRREMGGDDRDPPFFFSKPADALVSHGADVPYPPATENLHYEMELVIAIGAEGFQVSPDQALDLVFGYAAGVDLTRRDLQNAAKSKGHPWEAGKAFDHSAPISAIRRADGPPPTGRIHLSVNGDLKQDAVVSDMIWNVAEVIAEASKLWRLAPGDLIFTGTPENVGPVRKGDRIEGAVDGVGSVAFQLV